MAVAQVGRACHGRCGWGVRRDWWVGHVVDMVSYAKGLVSRACLWRSPTFFPLFLLSPAYLLLSLLPPSTPMWWAFWVGCIKRLVGGACGGHGGRVMRRDWWAGHVVMITTLPHSLLSSFILPHSLLPPSFPPLPCLLLPPSLSVMLQ